MAVSNQSSSVRAGYETTFVTRPEMTEDGLKALQERLNGVVGSFKGELVLSEDWGRRKLAYPIQKESRGHYSYFVYTGQGDIVHEIERNLRLNDQVLRFLTVNLETEFDAETFRKQRAAVHASAKRREEEREARREERMAERRGYDSDRSHSYDRGDRGGSSDAAAEAGEGSEE